MIKYILMAAIALPGILLAQNKPVKAHIKKVSQRQAVLKKTEETIPTDPAVRIGVLPNGFHYYLRKNSEPQKRAVFYLVNNVGSILETDEQRGIAHFMEHMNFNGTKHYPKNALVDYLQKAGVRFGADLNAYTGYDETVYQLPLPTNDPKMVFKGIDIMRDWAQEATLDSLEIEKERGVVLEEKRLGAGAQDRLSKQYLPKVLNHSRYAERMPIGTEQVLKAFKPQVIRKFYHDWYRPDLQALIVVGDIDVNETEKMIRIKFANLKNPAQEKKRIRYEMPLSGKGHFVTATDREAPYTSLEILFKHRAGGRKTRSDYRDDMKRTLLNYLIGARFFAELSNNSDPAYQGAGAGIQGLMGGVDMLAFTTKAKEGRLQESLEQSWRIIERITRFGFTNGELNRAKNSFLSSLENAVKEKDKTPSDYYVNQYQALFLRSEAAPDIDWEYAFCREQLAKIVLADIHQVLQDYTQSPDKDILVIGPEKEQQNLPDSVTFVQWLDNVHRIKLTPYEDETVAQSLITTLPAAGKVTAKKGIPEIGVTELTLSNGVKILLKPTGFKNDEVQFVGFTPGGTSLYAKDEYDAAANAASLMNGFGAGTFNPIQLSRMLNGKNVRVSAEIGRDFSSVNGFSSLTNLEAALQLTYLKVTQPRVDSLFYQNAVNNIKESLKYRYSNPASVFQDTMNYVLGNYNYQFAPPSVERVNTITPQRIYNIYKDRFANASAFTFVFVGSFDINHITPLLEKYLGALPANTPQKAGMVVQTPQPPLGQLTKKVYKGTENKATVRLVYTGNYDYNTINNFMIRALGEILQIRLIERLREQEGEVYSPRAQASYEKLPNGRYAFNISFGCAPQNVDHLINLVQGEFTALRNNGPSEDEVQKFKASYRKTLDLSLKTNAFWVGYLTSQTQFQENLKQITEADKNMDQVNVRLLTVAARKYLTGDNLIKFELLPESTNP